MGAYASVFLIGLFISLSTVLPEMLHAQGTSATALEKPIGKIISSSGNATVQHTATVVLQAAVASIVRANAGDFVYQRDIIQTGADGRLDITFTDGTTFNISPNARMVLDEFVYDPNSKANATLFSLTRGTFNFVAGKVADTGDMKITTPVGTMGIRGTAPRVEISQNGTVTFSTLVEPDAATLTQGRPR